MKGVYNALNDDFLSIICENYTQAPECPHTQYSWELIYWKMVCSSEIKLKFKTRRQQLKVLDHRGGLLDFTAFGRS